MSSSNFNCIAVLSRFCVFWMRNTMRKVTMVVPVLITSCHVLLKPKSGPVIPQATMIATATRNALGVPARFEVNLVK
jgi:hypothetical protein